MNNARDRRPSTEGAQYRVPLGYLFARFVQVYGMATFVSPFWPTRDHAIPFKLFYAMVAAIANVTAADQLSTYYAALLAGAQITGGEDGRSQRDESVRSLVDTAYPRVAMGAQ